MRLRIVTFCQNSWRSSAAKQYCCHFFGCLKKNLYICGKFKILTINGENYWKRA